MNHIISINEFFLSFNPTKGDELVCKNNYGFAGAYRQLPRIYDFLKGEKYKVINSNNQSVTIQSDQGTYFSKNDENKSTQIFSLKKGDKMSQDFPYLWDYFEKS
jgi:hypothetical protein